MAIKGDEGLRTRYESKLGARSQVPFPRLFLADFVGGMCGSIVTGFFALAALAG